MVGVRVARELADQRLDAERKRFDVGLSTSFFVIQAQRDLAQAKANELSAILAYDLALVDFEALQEAGPAGEGLAALPQGVDQWVTRGDPATRAFATFGFRNGKLAVVETVNRVGDHAAALRIIGTEKVVAPEDAADPAFDLRALAKK